MQNNTIIGQGVPEIRGVDGHTQDEDLLYRYLKLNCYAKANSTLDFGVSNCAVISCIEFENRNKRNQINE